MAYVYFICDLRKPICRKKYPWISIPNIEFFDTHIKGSGGEKIKAARTILFSLSALADKLEPITADVVGIFKHDLGADARQPLDFGVLNHIADHKINRIDELLAWRYVQQN